jgi:hypothetical protein
VVQRNRNHLRRWNATIGRTYSADCRRYFSAVQKYRDELLSPAATIAQSDVAAVFQPVEAQYAGEATERPPKRNDCYTYTRTVASASRESITMVARYHHLAIRFAQFGHDPALTSGRAIPQGRTRNAIEAGETLERKFWDECMREEPEMSERAREFLEHWLSGHVGAVADEYRMRETVRLVAQCREDAIRAGIVPDELRAAAGGNLIQHMLAALSAAAARTKQTADLD